MASQAMRLWTFSGLVSAFLHLAIAYFLLCLSTLAFLASKFLGFFGICLPCPCNNEPFGTSNRNYCWQRVLVDFPLETISSVQLSVQSNFPLTSICAKDQDYKVHLKLIRDGNNCIDGFVEVEGDALCNLVSCARESQNVAERDLVLRNESSREDDVVNSSLRVKKGRFDLKGKEIGNQRPRIGVRRRRKGLPDYAKPSSVWSSVPSCTDVGSPSSINNKGKKAIECSSLHVDCGADPNDFNYDEQAPIVRNLGERASHGFELNDPLDENKHVKEYDPSLEEIKSNVRKELDYDGNEKNVIEILEQSIKEEHAARAALLLELEKERSAAATSADEAMAMILRLQEEKASIEMGARQYQRIIEEKSAYDAEEMDILKEILVRREMEKHYLEKEAEAYRKMIYNGNEELHDDIQRQQLVSSLDPGEDPILMLRQLSESIDKKKIVKDNSSVRSISYVNEKNCITAVGQQIRISGWESDSTIPGDLGKQFSHKSGSSREHNDDSNQQKGVATKTSETRIVTDMHVPYNAGEDSYQVSKNVGKMILDMEPQVRDVRVVHRGPNFLEDVIEKKNERLLENGSLNMRRKSDLPFNASEIPRIDVTTDCPSTSGLDTKPGITRNSSDMSSGLPPLGGSSGKFVLSDLQRNFMSAVDIEKLKLDMEVGRLRERLRIVQERQEKLKREKSRQKTEPGKPLRQASLPLPSSKILSPSWLDPTAPIPIVAALHPYWSCPYLWWQW